jgi:hypothetical protein
MCVRLSVRPTTVPRFNWLAEPARTVGFRDRKPARIVGFCKLKIPHIKIICASCRVVRENQGSDSRIPRPKIGPDSRILQTKNPPQKIVCASCRVVRENQGPDNRTVPHFNGPAEPASAFSMAEPVLPVN